MSVHKPFTFYGNVLGVSAAYRLDPELAYRKLNDFYNTVLSILRISAQKAQILFMPTCSAIQFLYGANAL